MNQQNRDEFVSLIQQNIGIIYKICNIYGGAFKDDLKQEIIYQLWKSFTSFKGNSKFQTWMYRVALNTALFESNREKRKFAELNPSYDIADHSENPEEKVILVNQLYRHISKLKKIDRAITLLYLEKCSYREIAEITGLSEKNVGVKLTRIKEKLRAMFEKQNQ
ncbi:MAG: sigma-70 family RNA polymerase sigma factor [Prolixibacteraceae bacterium]|nr:sigma-70 family RNA polymerase sigma factor [Prolixibacteraceae bacterium]